MVFSNTNYNLFKPFLAVYKFRNISRAAKYLNLSQPTISHNIQELQNQLNTKLFSINTRSVEPTKAADELYKHIEPAIAKINIAERDLCEFNNQSTGVIHIAWATNFAEHILANYIKEFKKQYPNIYFEITPIKPNDVTEMLETRKVDFVFSTLQFECKSNLEKIALCQLAVTFFASKEYAETNGLQPIIRKEHFDKLSLISWEIHEPQKNTVAFAASQEMSFQLVMNNLGVSYCIEQFPDIRNVDNMIMKFNVEDIKIPDITLFCIYNKDCLVKSTKKFLSALNHTKT